MLNEEVPSQSAEKEFLILIKRKTVMQKNCYFLSDLVVELKHVYEMYCANENIRDSKKMKYFLQEIFKESICFKPARGIHGNPIVVHAHEVNPVDYVISSIIGAGLPDEEITISFAKIIHRKIKAQETRASFPLSAEKLFEELHKSD